MAEFKVSVISNGNLEFQDSLRTTSQLRKVFYSAFQNGKVWDFEIHYDYLTFARVPYRAVFRFSFEADGFFYHYVCRSENVRAVKLMMTFCNSLLGRI